jgi:hypothetical protein
MSVTLSLFHRLHAIECFLFHFSGSVAGDMSLSSVNRKPGPTSEPSIVILSHLAATEDQKNSSNEATDTSLKHEIYTENIEEKFNSFEEVTYSPPQTGMHKTLCTSKGGFMILRMVLAGNEEPG